VTVAAARAGLVRLTHAEAVMGTVVSFDVRVQAEACATAIDVAIPAARALLHQADATFSTWDADSPLSRVRRGELPLMDAPSPIAEVLDLCRDARTASGGWFDPWALPGGVDPTGLVKGWAAERALEALRARGVPAALVTAGGDVAALGRPSHEGNWRVGVRHPWRPDALACVLDVPDAVATSGSYERGAHLLDPRTGAPSARAASATVTGPHLFMADALATALAVGGDEALEAIEAVPGYEAYLVRPDGSERWTQGMAFSPA
jgi:thiamine biosynthesis lipoprotein